MDVAVNVTDDWFTSAGCGFGEKVAVTPEGRPVTLRFTEKFSEPEPVDKLKMPLTEPPWDKTRLEKDKLKLKLAKGSTVRETGAVELRLPLLA